MILPEAPLLKRADHALDVLSFALADVRYGLGPYAAVYLIAAHGWDEGSIALAFAFGSVAGLVTQIPIGATVDAVRAKRALLVGALAMVVASCFAIVLAPSFWLVAAAGVASALANSALGTTLAAISLGIVGSECFARRAARNEALFHAGGGATNLAILAFAPAFGITVVFWLLGTTAVASVAAILAVPARAINHERARGRGLQRDGEVRRTGPSSVRKVLTSRPLLMFSGCGALFHMANATMLGLVVQRAARTDPAGAVTLAAASMAAAQAAMVVTASLAAARADAWGRKPFFLVAFVALVVRGTCYTLSRNPTWTVAVQLLDGIGVGVFGALFPVVVADLTSGAGHFNTAQGGVGTVHGIGGLLSGPLGAACVMWAGYDTAFLALAAIAALGGVAFWRLMPETRPGGSVTERIDIEPVPQGGGVPDLSTVLDALKTLSPTPAAGRSAREASSQ